jgi:hypothetical protein
MIKRLLSFIRHMREPTFSDPKAARWVDLFQKRARFTGQLPEPDVLQRMGIPADDPFWKQDNANPSAGFAVNLGCRVGDALQVDSPANFDAVGVDDFGRSVTKFPILETAPHFYFHIANPTFSLDEASRVTTPRDFVWTAARMFRDLLKKIESEPDDPSENSDEEDDDKDTEPMSFDPCDYVISRITWDHRRKAWYVITEESKKFSSGAVRNCVDTSPACG